MAGPIPATAVAEAEPAALADAAAFAPADAGPEAPPAGALQSLADWLREGPFALALASSFFGFYAHAGALQGACAEIAPLAPALTYRCSLVRSSGRGGHRACARVRLVVGRHRGVALRARPPRACVARRTRSASGLT
jgi:hypothetical protein